MSSADKTNPVFLVGAERSGTTLLRLMLDGHPSISWLNEFEYSVDLADSPDKWPDIEMYADYLATNRIFQATNFTIDKTLEYPELIQSFLTQKQERDQKPLIGATCHRHYDRLLRFFPQSRFIHLLRDPRDVARSNIGMGWAGNVWKGIDRWIEAEELWKSVQHTLEENAYIEIRYEELVAAPEKILTTICTFLHVEYDDKMMSYPDYTTYSKPDPSLTEQWKGKMSPGEIELVESKIYDLMENLGYPPHSDKKKGPSFFRKIFLSVQDKLFRVRFKVKRYGFKLVVSSYLARKLGLKSLERRLKLLFNEREKSFLK